MPEAAGSTQVRYEVANALGRLYAERPKLAQVCNDLMSYARAVKLLLASVDKYCMWYGIQVTDLQRMRKIRLEVIPSDAGVNVRITGGL